MPRPALVFDRESVLTFVPANHGPTVYRIYQADRIGGVRRLLYVGASIDPRARLLYHLRRADLHEHRAGIVELEFFRTTTAMARAERNAIEKECPLLDSGAARRHHTWKAQRR